MTALRVGVDIGGTFTDIVALDLTGRAYRKKVSSSVDNYARAIVEGISELFAEIGAAAESVTDVIHGTTVASNAILELKGAKTGLITTKGFRDVLEIRRLRMPRLYDIAWEKPAPLVERYLRVEVDERINARGDIQKPLKDEDVERALDALAREGIESLAVCLLNAYADGRHEERVKQLAAARLPAVEVSISSEVLPEIREYERTSTTVINAYVMPIVRRYLARLTAGLSDIGINASLLIMQSNGGVMTAQAASRRPIHIIESGPAAGVIGARALARRIGIPRVISFDMGGTTAKASIIENGEVTRAAECQVGGGIITGARLLSGAGYLLRVPAIDLAEVGAGGGSVVWVDAGGALQVGPHSVGSEPGPACYERGGEHATITDANVVLGFLNPGFLVGGGLKLNPVRSHEVLTRQVAEPLNLSLEDAAFGAHLLAASNMILAIKAVSTERGRDPKDYVLVAFGGNGPLFAASLAAAIGIGRVIIPPAPGVFSAFGLLCSEIEYHYVRTCRMRTDAADVHALNKLWRDMEAEAHRQLDNEGFGAAARRITRMADLCYHGQTFELTLPVPEEGLDILGIEKLTERFGQEHERTYGHRAGSDEPVDLVNLRIFAQGVTETPRMPERVDVERDAGRPTTQRRAYFGPAVGWLVTTVIGRSDLTRRVEGPCIVEEYDATCVVPPGCGAALDQHGNIVIDIPEGQEI